jgi:hypothetical protein
MDEYNEYRERLLSLLGEDEPFAVLSKTPGLVVDVLGRIGDEGLSRRFAPGKWTSREVFAHLADVEQGTGFRIRQILWSPPGHVVQPFDQDLWAKPYHALPAHAAARAFVALRTWNLFYYRTLSPEDRSKIGFHPERGDESVEILIRMQAGHDRNHLAQLETIAAMSPPEPAPRLEILLPE